MSTADTDFLPHLDLLNHFDQLDPAFRHMLAAFQQGVQRILPANLVAIYVMGSLLMGDFAAATSDVDFLVVTARPLNENEADTRRVAALHARLARDVAWGDRLEGGYAAQEQLRPWGIEGAIVAVEPGKAVQAQAPNDYTAENMLALRDTSLTLYGPAPRLVIPPVDRATFDAALRAYLAELLVRPDETEPAPEKAAPEELASWALNIARCLYGLRGGRPCTKSDAAAWFAAEAPAVRPILTAALAVRRGAAASTETTAILHDDFAVLQRVAAQCLHVYATIAPKGALDLIWS